MTFPLLLLEDGPVPLATDDFLAVPTREDDGVEGAGDDEAESVRLRWVAFVLSIAWGTGVGLYVELLATLERVALL